MHLVELFKRFRKGIILALSLVVIENVAWIIEPTVFGKVIDAVIDVQVERNEIDSLKQILNNEIIGQESESEISEPSKIDKLKTAIKDSITILTHKRESSYLLPFVIWIIVFVINSGMGVIRRSVDPKIFLRIYNQIATEVSEKSVKKRLSISKTAARAELSHEYIGFLQYRIPEILENIIAIGGAIIALYFFDYLISLTCLFIIIPLYFSNRLYSRKVSILQKEYHDQYEDIYDVFAKKDREHVREYYNKLALPQKKIANWGALNFGLMRMFLLLIFVAVLYIAIDLDDFSAGELYSIIAYLWTFVTATEHLPELLESWTSLKDISRRMKFEI